MNKEYSSAHKNGLVLRLYVRGMRDQDNQTRMISPIRPGQPDPDDN
jgi:hypothetical protein